VDAVNAKLNSTLTVAAAQLSFIVLAFLARRLLPAKAAAERRTNINLPNSNGPEPPPHARPEFSATFVRRQT
jgi:hypothetical protein